MTPPSFDPSDARLLREAANRTDVLFQLEFGAQSTLGMASQLRAIVDQIDPSVGPSSSLAPADVDVLASLADRIRREDSRVDRGRMSTESLRCLQYREALAAAAERVVAANGSRDS